MKFFKYILIAVFSFSGQFLIQNVLLAQESEIQVRVLEWVDGTRYEGGVLNGKMHGEGVIYWSDGTRFEGNFNNDLRDGPGRIVFPDGTIYSGVFNENQLLADQPQTPPEMESETATQQQPRETLDISEAPMPQAAGEEMEVIVSDVTPPVNDGEDTVEPLSVVEASTVAPLRYTDELENEIVAVLDAWANAWSAQNGSLYLSFYSDNFQVPDGLSRAAWERQRRERLNNPGFIQVDVGYAQFELVNNQVIEVYLRQGYTSDDYSDFSNKLMRLEKEDGFWKIVVETTI